MIKRLIAIEKSAVVVPYILGNPTMSAVAPSITHVLRWNVAQMTISSPKMKRARECCREHFLLPHMLIYIMLLHALAFD